jgi:hypothetical protein
MRKAKVSKLVQAAGGCKYSRLLISLLLCVYIPFGFAQDEEQKGMDSGNYNVKQSVEFGYRFTDFTGNQDVYDTFVNLRQGPRLLGLTTEMRSLDHHGTLFDNLYLSNFGYGGDPNDVSRLRIGKNKWYDFTSLFRRDENDWDYSLLANPLNPPTAFANAPAGFSPIISASPHRFNTVRRLGDYNLILLPQSRLRFRLGYSRNVSEGPSFTTLHEGTEGLLLQDTRNTINAYHVGVDFRLLSKTSISYDQFWNYYKGDTGYSDNNLLFPLANGTPVDIGVSLNSTASQPCAGTFLASPAGAVNPACNAYLGYSRHGRTRTSNPTEQLSFQSNYVRNLDLSGRFSYTGGDMSVSDWFENLAGRTSRTNVLDRASTGPVTGRRVADTADFGATLHVTEKFSILDSFHFENFHNPAEWDSTLCQFFSSSMLTPPRVFTPAAALASCASPTGALAGTPVHIAGSPADVSTGVSALFLGQDEKTNLFELEYQFTPRLGARLGYRFRGRTESDADFEAGTFLFYPNLQNGRSATVPFTGNCPAASNAADGSCLLQVDPQFDSGEVQIHEHSGVFGFWARPIEKWRINFDTELMSADNTFTRISPRQLQEYRLRSTYSPASWVNVSGTLNILESRNNVTEINNLQHNRAYGFSAMLEPQSRFSWEMGYDYNDVYSQILICYTSTTAPTGISKCPGSTVLVQQLSTYTNTSHYGYFDLLVRPYKPLAIRVGGNITDTSGSALLIAPTAPSGPLDSRYYRPYAGFDYTFAKNWTGKAYWGYYGYSEDQTTVAQDVFAPRNFRGNMTTLSLRYAF